MIRDTPVDSREGGGNLEFIWGVIFFQKFLNKLLQRDSDFGGQEYFFENSIAPPPRVNWYIP